MGRRPARAVSVLERFHSFPVQAVDALAHGLAIQLHANRDGGGGLPAGDQLDDLRPLHQVSRSGARVS
jgi:hypothetical protein